MAHLSQGVALPGLVRVLPDVPSMQLPVWLTSHGELKTNARVRRTFDVIAEQLRRAQGAIGVIGHCRRLGFLQSLTNPRRV